MNQVPVNNVMRKALILTALPFRKQGNQSLLRFVEMFLEKDIAVLLHTSGKDARGERVLQHHNFELKNVLTLRETLLGFFRDIKKKFSQHKPIPEEAVFYGATLPLSQEIVPPFGVHNRKTMLLKWGYFLLTFFDNLCLFIFFLLRPQMMRNIDLVVGYEVHYGFASFWLAKLFRKKYMNKFQGTVLVASRRSVKDCLLYYPTLYFGIQPSDLCVMVNDGTDGKYYASLRGCKNIYFESHGVAVQDYQDAAALPWLENYRGRFIIFNNASGSTWKRVDRIIRPLAHLPKAILDKLLVITTYYGPDLLQMKLLAKGLAVEDSICFLEKCTHQDSNAFLRNSHVLFSSNDLSNLGNPVLEAIYYGIPVMSIADGTTQGFLTHQYDSLLIPLNEDFDRSVAHHIERLISEPDYYHRLKTNMQLNQAVHTLQQQQRKELAAMSELFCCESSQ